MIFISPKGMTITEWINEKHRLSYARGRTRKGKQQKRTERAFARNPLFGRGSFQSVFAMMFLSQIFSRGKK